VGTGKIVGKYLKDLKAAGVELERYHPLRWYNLGRMNNRTHRKLLVVDGRTGFTGGVGIADLWQGNAESKDHWRDSHYQIEGPAVAQMQAAFTDNWIKTRAQVLFGSNYFPEVKPVGNSRAQVFKSSRGEGSESVRLMYLLSIASATKTIRLQAAYFVPDDLAIATFVAARKRGGSRSSCPDRTPMPSWCRVPAVRSGVRCWTPAWKFTSTSRPCTIAKSSSWMMSVCRLARPTSMIGLSA
jgi:cardiolipin synthase